MHRSAPRRSSLLHAAAMLATLTAAAGPAAAQGLDGGALFENHCASCHLATAIPRALAIDNMRALPPEAIVGALTDGAMREQGAELRPAERRANRRVHHGSARHGGGAARPSPARPSRTAAAAHRRLGAGRGRTAVRRGMAGAPA